MTYNRISLLALVLVVATAAGIAAQVPVQAPAKPVAPTQPAKGAAAKIEGLGDGTAPEWVRLSYKLRVRLNNGRTIIGIVRNGRLFEKIVLQGKISAFERSLKRKYGITPSRSLTQRFVPAKPTDERVGIRLWHHDATGGYIFLFYVDIKVVKRMQVISMAELNELDERARRRNKAKKDEIQKKWEEAAKKRRAAIKKQIAVRESKAKTSKEAKKVEKGSEIELGDKSLEKLLKKFHPGDGWTPGRKRVIEWRKWTLGLYPNEKEKEFLASYDEWKKAYDKWMSEYAEKEKEKDAGKEKGPAPKEAGEKTPGSTPSDSRR